MGKQQYLVILAVLETLLPWQLRITLLFWHLKDNKLHAWQTYSFLVNSIKWFTGQYWNVVTMVYLLRLLTHVGFLRQNGLILSEAFLYMERSKNQEKNIS